MKKQIIISVKGGLLTVVENHGKHEIVIIDKDREELTGEVIELTGLEDVVIELCKGAADVKKCIEDLEVVFIDEEE